mmetsp:Transcript_147960/g.475064  ORF Transcript_147960/g.475064 Transcript_147960/m.475064 type:complete len:408 (-) Transcript_147960:111-1334(-)
MPHCYSPAARALRRERAIIRGFLTPAPSLDHRWVAAPVGLHGRVKSIVKSLEMHHSHNELNGFACHHARSATLTAKKMGRLLPVDTESALLAHRAANHAKHNWTCSAGVDPLQLADPWCRVPVSSHCSPPEVDPWKDFRPTSAPRSARGTVGAGIDARFDRIEKLLWRLLDISAMRLHSATTSAEVAVATPPSVVSDTSIYETETAVEQSVATSTSIDKLAATGAANADAAASRDSAFISVDVAGNSSYRNKVNSFDIVACEPQSVLPAINDSIGEWFTVAVEPPDYFTSDDCCKVEDDFWRRFGYEEDRSRGLFARFHRGGQSPRLAPPARARGRRNAIPRHRQAAAVSEPSAVCSSPSVVQCAAEPRPECEDEVDPEVELTNKEIMEDMDYEMPFASSSDEDEPL